MSLLELQKFLLEYQRVSSTQGQALVTLVIQCSKGSLAVELGCFGCGLLCLAQHIRLEREVL